MQLKNTYTHFGAITKLLHWSIFILIATEFFLIWTRDFMAVDNPLQGTYIFLHKAIGVTILLIAIFWIIWRLFNVLPAAMPKKNNWERPLAKLIHNLLLASIVILPIVGILMSFSNGRGVDWFGIVTMTPPAFFPPNETWAGIFRGAHEYIAYTMIALVALHAAGALVHHFIYKDTVLRRMLPFTKIS